MTDLLNNPVSFHDIEYQFATSGVYAIYCKHTDTYYIGQGVVVLRRLVDHFSQLREGCHPNDLLQREFNQVGVDEYVVDLLADIPAATQADLLRRESEEIQRFKAHGKRLYNKVSGAIRITPPVLGVATTTKPVRENNGNGTQLTSHAEKIAETEPAPATCYDCGSAGLSQVEIFKCDDGFNRCQSCIESYLDKWRFDISHAKKIPQVKKGSYRRWLVPQGAPVQEHIMLASKKFAERFGRMPERVFIHPSLEAPDTYRGIEIVRGGIAVGRYIDIPIE